MIHVVYNIYKLSYMTVSFDEKPIEIKTLHDCVIHSDQIWLDGHLITGGIREVLEKKYPESEGYSIKVETLLSPGNQSNE